MNAWDELVEEGKRIVSALSDDKMRLGDLIAEACGMGNAAALDEYADAVGLATGTASRYRMVATAWPKETRREGISFTVYAELGLREDRFEILDRLVAAGEPITKRRIREITGVALDTVGARAEVESVRAALADPEIADQVLSDDTTSAAVDEARSRQWQRDRESIRDTRDEPVDREPPPAVRGGRDTDTSTRDAGRLTSSVIRVARAIAEIEQAVVLIEGLDDPLDQAEFANHFDHLRQVIQRYDRATTISDDDLQALVGNGGEA